MKFHDQPIFDFGQLMGASGEAAKASVASFREMQQLTVDFWLQLGSEAVRFAAARFGAQAELLDSLRGCAEAAALGEKEAQFLTQSADECRKVFKRMGEITREAGDRILAAAPGPEPGRKAA